MCIIIRAQNHIPYNRSKIHWKLARRECKWQRTAVGFTKRIHWKLARRECKWQRTAVGFTKRIHGFYRTSHFYKPALQWNHARNKGVVSSGADIGFHVFPTRREALEFFKSNSPHGTVLLRVQVDKFVASGHFSEGTYPRNETWKRMKILKVIDLSKKK